MAAEAIAAGVSLPKPLPAWSNLHAWYVADNGMTFDGTNAVNRWAGVHNGSAVRDLTRKVSGFTFRRNVVAGNGQPRKVMRFDGSNDLWANSTPAAPAEGVDPLKDGFWSTVYRLPTVPDPVCQASVIPWKSRLAGYPREWSLFANPATGGRDGMALRLSQNGGFTWPVSRLLYAGSAAYSSLTTLPDGLIGLFFERDGYTKITFARVEEA